MHTIIIDTAVKTTGENLWQIYTELGHLSLAVVMDRHLVTPKMREYLEDLRALRREVKRTYDDYCALIDDGAPAITADRAVMAGDIVTLVNRFGQEHPLHGEPLCKVEDEGECDGETEED
jgi:hypothetical protein